MDVGVGGGRFELIGPPRDEALREWLRDDCGRIIPPTPWRS